MQEEHRLIVITTRTIKRTEILATLGAKTLGFLILGAPRVQQGHHLCENVKFLLMEVSRGKPNNLSGGDMRRESCDEQEVLTNSVTNTRLADCMQATGEQPEAGTFKRLSRQQRHEFRRAPNSLMAVGRNEKGPARSIIKRNQ